MKAAPRKPPVKEMAPCDLCKREIEKAEGFCSGCGHIVCEICDKTQPWGRHNLLDHRED